MSDEDDPFDVFGGDEDDSSDDGSDGGNDNKVGHATPIKDSIAIAMSLVESANQKIIDESTSIRISQTLDASLPNDTGNGDRQETEDLSYLNEWENKWPDPMYKAQILLVSPIPVGGGRGYVATRLIPPGSLVLVESPMIAWPEEQLGKKLEIVSVKHLIEHPNATQFVHDLEDLHPTKDQVDMYNQNENDTLEERNEEHEQIYKMINLLLLEHSSAPEGESEGQSDHQKAQGLLDVVALSQSLGIRSRDGSILNPIDVIRLLLVLRYNGLESGVYRHVAMLNHDDYPNCAKFLPTDGRSFSEVRTTRPVQKGETLTISYISRTVSHASRRKLLWEQHRFDIGTKHLKGDRYKMELIGKNLPPSPLVGSFDPTLTDRIENSTEDLERMQTEIEALQPLGTPETYETAKALEQTILELYKTSVEQLQNSKHILLIPILSLHIEICALVLKDASLTNSNQLGVLSRQTVSGYNLLPLQKEQLGADHFILARTSLDLADCISQLLSRSSKSLCDLKLPSMETYAACLAFERQTRKEHNRIKALYPHDVDKHINN